MPCLQIRRDPRINWIAKAVHKRREARGLTSIGKQVRFVARMLHLGRSHKIPYRTVVWARVIVTIILQLGRPGRSTTPSVFVATDDLVVVVVLAFCLFPAYYYAHVIPVLAMHVCYTLELSLKKKKMPHLSLSYL